MRRASLLVLLAAPAWVLAQEAPTPTTKAEPGIVWAAQVVRATGSGAPDVKAPNPAHARLGAERAAQMDALRNLLAQVKGIRISADRTMADALASDELRGKVEGVLKGYKVVAKRYFSDSGVEIDVEVPLAGITELVVPVPAAPASRPPAPAKGAGPTGLVIDAQGVKLTPSLAPRVLDEAGAVLFDAASVPGNARAEGTVGWSQKVDEARREPRVGAKPLVVKAKEAKGADLVLSAKDAKKVSQLGPEVLGAGRVVVVIR